MLVKLKYRLAPLARGLQLNRRCRSCAIALTPGNRPGPADEHLAGLCADCAGALAPAPGEYCQGCGLPLPDDGEQSGLCSDCIALPRPWSRLVFHGLYQGRLRRLLTEFKFSGRLGHGALLRDLALQAWRLGLAGEREQAAPELIVPVPLHRKRLRQRGYNQSLELARGLAKELGARLAPHAVLRERATRPQMSLSREERLTNLAEAFVADKDQVRGKRVLLADDIMTTGATLGEVARCLSKAGAARVDVLVLARTLESGQNPEDRTRNRE